MTELWHTARTRSWWDGTVITWCGQRLAGGDYETDTWLLPRGGTTCPACTQARRASRS